MVGGDFYIFRQDGERYLLGWSTARAMASRSLMTLLARAASTMHQYLRP